MLLILPEDPASAEGPVLGLWTSWKLWDPSTAEVGNGNWCQSHFYVNPLEKNVSVAKLVRRNWEVHVKAAGLGTGARRAGRRATTGCRVSPWLRESQPDGSQGREGQASLAPPGVAASGLVTQGVFQMARWSHYSSQ